MRESDDDKATVDYTWAAAPCRRRPLNQTGRQAGILAGHMEVGGAHGGLIARPPPNCLPACSHSLLRTSEKKTARAGGSPLVSCIQGAGGEVRALRGLPDADLDLRRGGRLG